MPILKAKHESARHDHVMDVAVRRGDREVSRTRVHVAHVTAEPEPSERARIDAPAELECASIGVALIRIRAAVGPLLGLGVARVAGSHGPEDRDGAGWEKREPNPWRQVQRGILATVNAGEAMNGTSMETAVLDPVDTRHAKVA